MKYDDRRLSDIPLNTETEEVRKLFETREGKGTRERRKKQREGLKREILMKILGIDEGWKDFSKV